jgi:raffinose/stachyose/melibiose transport system permease protein
MNEGKRRISDYLIEFFLFLFAVAMLYPIYFLYAGSFKEPGIFYDPFAFPTRLFTDYYKIVFERVDILSGFMNTLLILVISLIGIVVVGSLAGYAIARVNNWFFKFLYFFFLSGMIIPLQATMVTIFKMGVSLNLMDTRIFLILLYMKGSIAMTTFIYTGFMKSIPKEIEESAFIDGAGALQSFFRIVFPLLMPATGTIMILYATLIYNDFFTPLLYLRDPEKLTLMPQIIQFYANKFDMNYGPVFAMSALAVLPLLVVFVFTQKYMIKGLVSGSLKG